MENLNLEESSGSTDIVTSKKLKNILKKDLVTTCGDVSKNLEDAWRSGLKWYREEEAKYVSEASHCTQNKYHMCVIINNASEETDNENNPATNPKPGVNRRADRETRQAAVGREKVHLSGEEWRMIKAAINHGAAIPAYLRREVLMGYQYALHQQKKQLLRERSEIWRMHELAVQQVKYRRRNTTMHHTLVEVDTMDPIKKRQNNETKKVTRKTSTQHSYQSTKLEISYQRHPKKLW
jgi:hypothetical protein